MSCNGWKRIGEYAWKKGNFTLRIVKNVWHGGRVDYLVTGQVDGYPSFDYYKITQGDPFAKLEEAEEAVHRYLSEHQEEEKKEG
jgi:hypothetical protein